MNSNFRWTVSVWVPSGKKELSVSDSGNPTQEMGSVNEGGAKKSKGLGVGATLRLAIARSSATCRLETAARSPGPNSPGDGETVQGAGERDADRARGAARAGWAGGTPRLGVPFPALRPVIWVSHCNFLRQPKIYPFSKRGSQIPLFPLG